jgi:hypothetical protein
LYLILGASSSLSVGSIFVIDVIECVVVRVRVVVVEVGGAISMSIFGYCCFYCY